MSALVPCTACSRHVRATESACPFCHHDLPANLASRAIPSPTRRLDRLATFTFAVGLTVAACGGVSGDGDTVDPQDQTQDDEAELRKKKKDAGSAAPDAGCVEDVGGFHALYGMPPFTPPPPPCAKDAGAPRDAGHADANAKDAGRVKDSGGIHAMYGAPFTPPDEDEDGGGFHALYGMPPTP